MRKIIMPLLCLGMLCACADKKESSVSSAADKAYVAATEAETTSSAKSTTTTTADKTTAETHPSTQIELGTPPPLTLNSATGLNETHSRSIFDTLSEPPYYFYTHEDSNYYYRMSGEDNTLSYEGKQICYVNSSGEECIDTYRLSADCNETLINRNINGKTVFVNPCQIYINRQNNALYINLKETGELVQTIEGDFSSDVDKYEGAGGFEEFYYQGVDVLEFADYDFDGFDDIFFQTSIHTANEPGIYFRFNPETCLFEEWAELNKIGLQCYFIRDSKNLKVSITSSAVDHKTTIYKWNNECLVPVSREVQYADAHNDVYIDSYEYNENSEEILVKREKALLDEDKNWLGTEEVEIPEVIK